MGSNALLDTTIQTLTTEDNSDPYDVIGVRASWGVFWSAFTLSGFLVGFVYYTILTDMFQNKLFDLAKFFNPLAGI